MRGKLIYIANSFIGNFGGAAFVAEELVDSLYSSGVDVSSVCVDYKITDRLTDRVSDIKNYSLPFLPPKQNYSKSSFGSLRYYLKNVQWIINHKKLTFQINKNKPEIVFCNDNISVNYFLKYHYKKFKIFQIVHMSPGFFENFEESNMNQFIENLKKSDAIIFVSDECRKKWLKYVDFTKLKTYYVPNCTNEKISKKCLSNSKHDVRKKLAMQSNKFYLVTVASFQPRKGLDLLINSAPELKKIAPDLEILLIGSDRGAYAEELKKKVKNTKAGFIKFLGRKDNAMEYIYASDTFILPSRAEAFPLVILEAMALKTPVIASNVDGIPEMIRNEKSGLLFESDNQQALIGCFKKVYGDLEARNKYADQASKIYWNNFSKVKFTKRYLEIIDKS